MAAEGTILHLQRFSTEDGPGLRTTVFFKGCSLRCAWCHNPESLLARQEVQWLENHCIRCKTCLKACPHQALSWTDHGVARNRAACQVCGACVEACPASAHELLGQRIQAKALVKELLKDRAFFEKSGGGVTLSGGEPTLQPGFALALLRTLGGTGISTALDTCGFCQEEVLAGLAAESDLVLFDVKLLDAQAHRRWTGVENQGILNNLTWLGGYLVHHPEKSLWIRTPLIPGATFTENNLAAIGAWLAEHLDGRVDRWELCAFNNLCRDKYCRLDREWPYATVPLLSQADLEQACGWARGSGFDPTRVFVTGAARSKPV